MEVLSLLQKNFQRQVLVSLMAQYIPCGKAQQYPEINRKITRREYQKVLDCLFALDLAGFTQELTAADMRFVPNFDLSGIP